MTDARDSREAELSMQVIELKTEIRRLELCMVEGEKRFLLEIKVLRRANDILRMANETQKKLIEELWTKSSNEKP